MKAMKSVKAMKGIKKVKKEKIAKDMPQSLPGDLHYFNGTMREIEQLWSAATEKHEQLQAAVKAAMRANKAANTKTLVKEYNNLLAKMDKLCCDVLQTLMLRPDTVSLQLKVQATRACVASLIAALSETNCIQPAFT